MSVVLGVDTSNYTTSAAVAADGEIAANLKRPLKVAQGARGLRQSDAVFGHTVNLAPLMEEMAASFRRFDAVGYSARPRDAEGSYMPCFLVGEAFARSYSSLEAIPAYDFSHQAGHVAAAAYSSGHIGLLDGRFLAFHVSGGTTEILLCGGSPDGLKVERLGGTLDLNAGQVIDRVGVTLGLAFPCGAAMEKLAAPYAPDAKPMRTCARGFDCCLSGLENQCAQLRAKGASDGEVAAHAIVSVTAALEEMARAALAAYPGLPLLFAGGVMSDKLIRDRFTEEFGAFFAEPEFSCDNAAGVALLASRRLGQR